MRIESDNNTSIAACMIVFILGLACVVMHGRHEVEETKRAAIQAGLEQTVQDSRISTETIWAHPAK